MFTWICPKCGKEVPPSYSECPNCASTGAAPQPADAKPESSPWGSPPSAPAQAPTRPAAPPKPESRARTWLMGLVAALSIVVVVLTILVLARGNRESRPAPAAAPAPVAMETPATQAQPPANPAFKPLELTGFRINEDAQKKAQIQFVAVNHSGADLGDLKARVHLRAANAGPQDPPAASFNLEVSLGPYESKELKTALETTLRSYELPDWQLLRAEVVPQ